MSLLSTYDNRNMVTHQDLLVTYRMTFEAGYWVATRYAKKSYSFIGMTRTAANLCAGAKISQYTRSFMRLGASELVPYDDPTTSADSYILVPSTVYAVECPTEIAPIHGEGASWSVQINVNEEDVVAVASVQPPADLASLFAEANGRNYDEDAGSASITLISATRTGDKLACSYSIGISPSPYHGLIVVQYKTTMPGTGWISAGTIAVGGVTVPADGTLYVRLCYGPIESNTLTVS